MFGANGGTAIREVVRERVANAVHVEIELCSSGGMLLGVVVGRVVRGCGMEVVVKRIVQEKRA